MSGLVPGATPAWISKDRGSTKLNLVTSGSKTEIAGQSQSQTPVFNRDKQETISLPCFSTRALHNFPNHRHVIASTDHPAHAFLSPSLSSSVANVRDGAYKIKGLFCQTYATQEIRRCNVVPHLTRNIAAPSTSLNAIGASNCLKKPVAGTGVCFWMGAALPAVITVMPTLLIHNLINKSQHASIKNPDRSGISRVGVGNDLVQFKGVYPVVEQAVADFLTITITKPLSEHPIAYFSTPCIWHERTCTDEFLRGPLRNRPNPELVACLGIAINAHPELPFIFRSREPMPSRVTHHLVIGLHLMKQPRVRARQFTHQQSFCFK